MKKKKKEDRVHLTNVKARMIAWEIEFTELAGEGTHILHTIKSASNEQLTDFARNLTHGACSYEPAVKKLVRRLVLSQKWLIAYCRCRGCMLFWEVNPIN